MNNVPCIGKSCDQSYLFNLKFQKQTHGHVHAEFQKATEVVFVVRVRRPTLGIFFSCVFSYILSIKAKHKHGIKDLRNADSASHFSLTDVSFSHGALKVNQIATIILCFFFQNAKCSKFNIFVILHTCLNQLCTNIFLSK